jgi:hypothetical protein
MLPTLLTLMTPATGCVLMTLAVAAAVEGGVATGPLTLSDGAITAAAAAAPLVLVLTVSIDVGASIALESTEPLAPPTRP